MEDSSCSSSPKIYKPKPVYRGNRFNFRHFKEPSYDFEEKLYFYLKNKKLDYLNDVSFEEMENDFKNLKNSNNENNSKNLFLLC